MRWAGSGRAGGAKGGRGRGAEGHVYPQAGGTRGTKGTRGTRGTNLSLSQGKPKAVAQACLSHVHRYRTCMPVAHLSLQAISGKWGNAPMRQ